MCLPFVVTYLTLSYLVFFVPYLTLSCLILSSLLLSSPLLTSLLLSSLFCSVVLLGTSGCVGFDYNMVDRRVVPPETATQLFSEHIIYLPHTYQANAMVRE